MGDSRPPAAVIDLVDSYARRRDGQVEIILANPETAIGDNPVLVLRQGERRLKAPARLVEDGAGRRLVATVPPRKSLRGTWKIRIRSDSEVTVRVEARLLVQGPRRPVVLLWGANDSKSRLPDSNRLPVDQTPAPASTGPLRATAHKVLRRISPARR